MQHSNAKLTPAGRRRLVSLVVDDGLSLELAARRSGVSKTTAWEWTTRWRAACASDRRSWACLKDRSSCSRSSDEISTRLACAAMCPSIVA